MTQHVTMMNVKRKADIERSLAMIEVMNRINYVFSHGPLARITEIQSNISPITVEPVRPTTDINRQERKRKIVRMADPVHVFNDKDLMVFGGDNECHFCRGYTISLLPVIPIHRSHFADSKVTPPENGPSQPLNVWTSLIRSRSGVGISPFPPMRAGTPSRIRHGRDHGPSTPLAPPECMP
jgi:hypothetical protein